MQNLTDRFVQLIDQQLKALNTNAFAVEQAHGLPPDSIRNVLRSEKRSGPTLAKAEDICNALGLEILVRPQTMNSGFTEPSETQPHPQSSHVRTDFLPIPWHEEAMRRGGCPIAFEGSWLDEIGVITDNLAALMPDFVDLEGPAWKNTVAIIDTKAPLRGSSELWCYKASKQIRVARIAFTDKVTVILPKNVNDPPTIYSKVGSERLRILGKVSWMGAFTQDQDLGISPV